MASADGIQSFWVQNVGGFGGVDSDKNARGSNYKAIGLAGGYEIDLYDAQLGLFGGYTYTKSDVKGLEDNADVQSYQIGFYGRNEFKKDWHVLGSVTLPSKVGPF